MSGLRELDLTGTPITSGSVSKLRALGRLERLWLDRTLINDECVPALASLQKLKKLSLTETKLNDLSLETLRKDLGDCEVVS
jgi:Leucine-rich repeat (LRR) protein